MSFLSLILVLVGFARAVENPFRVEVADATVAPGGTAKIVVTVVVPKGFHVYRDMMDVTPVGAGKFTIGEESFPPGLMKEDPAAPGTQREQYEDDVIVEVPVTAPADATGTQDVALLVRYQGCKKNLCYFPQEEAVSAKVSVVGQAGAIAPLVAPAQAAPPGDPNAEVAVVFTGKAGEPNKATIGVDLKGDWHVNKAFVTLSLPEPGGYALGEVVLPPGEKTGSEADGTAREDYVHDLDLVVPITGPQGPGKVKVEVGYQACKGVSICRMPTSEIVEVPVVIGEGLVAASASPAKPALSDGGGFAAAAAKGTGALVLLCFLAGIGVSFTPCVLPMVPITMGLIGARGAGSRAKAIALSATYTLGMAAVYTGLGVFAGVTGALFGSWLQNVWVVGGIAVFFFVMGFAMFGFFDVGIPSALASRLSGKGGGGGFGGALVLGVIGAILAGPCSGPVVAAILALIGQGGQVGLGAALMFAFSLGIGVIFLVTGAASGWLPSRGPWMVLVKKSFGIVMWLGAIYYAAPHLSTEVTALLTAAVLLATAVFSWPSAEDGEGETLQRLRQVYSLGGGLVGAYLLVGTLVQEGFILPPLRLGSAEVREEKIEWLASEAEGLARAQAEGKPMMIDFTAEWCAACHELEKYTYTDPRVIAAAKDFVPVMIDCTKDKDPGIVALQKKYGVTGLPTVLFVKPDGTVMGQVIEFIEADAFLTHMEAAKRS
ncbi:MAG: protein-disulfide reductase DsbD domain-containing protein [Myxococcota bacterium]